MTSEMRTLIELGDVTGVEMECPECHLAIFYPVAKLFKIAPSCPHCNHQWFDERPDRHPSEKPHPAIESLHEIASQLRTLTRKDRTDIHAKIRLRITAEPEKR
jgi:hypothetical protein